uniref:RING-type domain-containing protein n=1 Tax=Chromera velia CCMP2878 TaxID=1169474 RepID=A0A0G4H7I8_9ALVE|eukprot:Cvel_24954.t1-p1 / transcript=Cvel_24954.t1 / gene=Cvel_24954 / organism=Chromera_velia_CCMP2878 / gene_product=TNF receptor-associated factor family protein, putative / transcript_product=TNF receptor-associated factor family protein, putative / location=Cvel_scaffold2763:5593-12591(-) / protein_length=327 / sequence_SO=supercontig / SO=protein_coding / is_pseudo=false
MNSKIRRLGLDASYAAAGSEDVVDNALCPICHDYIEDARETDCDARHVFCGPCIKDVSDRKQPCPCCRGAFSKMERPQALTRAFIEQVKWKCVHFERGCSFTGTKKQLEKHLDDECTIQEVKFPFSGCPTKMQRGPLDDHKKACPYRMAPCDHCKEQVRFNFKAAHKMVCPKFPIPCPQMCGRNLARDEVASHLQKECAEMVVACSVPGCGERMKRKLTDKHEDDNMKKHVKLLHIQLEKMKTLHSQVNFSPQRDRVQLNSGTLEMTVRFPDYETKAAGMAKDQYFESIPFLFEASRDMLIDAASRIISVLHAGLAICLLIVFVCPL